MRPVRELKSFRKIHLRPGERKEVEFTLHARDLAYFNARGESVLEPGRFAVWVGGDSSAELVREFELLPSDDQRSQSSSIARAHNDDGATPAPAPVVANGR